MRAFAIVVLLGVAATAAAQAVNFPSGSMALIIDYGDWRGNIGSIEMSMGESGKVDGQLNWTSSPRRLPPGLYRGYLHEKPPNAKYHCHATGRFLVENPSGHSERYIRPADITVYDDGRSPTLEMRLPATLNPNSDVSLLNRTIVFHTPNVLDWIRQGFDKVSAGLHETTAFCGFLLDTTKQSSDDTL